ncbi:ArsR family transcriptional regulator [Acidiplasma sp.]|uniref:ArsR/SmtB family transcription factor n=1 Tax=Acidiplasma sp. TaxID=1872114 RepID=UPI0031671D60
MISIEDDLWTLLNILENNTRRELLKMLANYDSYALELSKAMGISQQAIKKQLDILEKIGLVSASGIIPSSLGAPRKIYKSQGFSTIIIDYSKNFMGIKKLDIEYENKVDLPDLNISLIKKLNDINNAINDIEKKRTELLAIKDKIIEKLKTAADKYDDFCRKVIRSFLENLDISRTSKETGVPEYVVNEIITKFTSE